MKKKLFEKFGVKHSCTCGDKYCRPGNERELIGCDFKNKNKEGFKGYIWYKTTCTKCKNDVLIGTSYSDFRLTGEGLLLSAIKECANDFSYQKFNLLTDQFYKGKHFHSKFITKQINT